jgi:hypothetical protein
LKQKFGENKIEMVMFVLYLVYPTAKPLPNNSHGVKYRSQLAHSSLTDHISKIFIQKNSQFIPPSTHTSTPHHYSYFFIIPLLPAA